MSQKRLFMKQSNMSLTTLFETRLAVFYAYFGFMPQLCGIITSSVAFSVTQTEKFWNKEIKVA
jgi:hypothetical protein